MSKRNGVNGSNGHVSLSREEYAALMAREEAYESQLGNVSALRERAHDQSTLITSQAARMNEQDIRVAHLERIVATQRHLIDMMRADHPAIASLEDLSEFWRQWTAHTENLAQKAPHARPEVQKYEPDIFKSWRLWVRDLGKTDRVFIAAGSRAEVDDSQPRTSKEMQEHMLRRLREENFKLSERARTAEDELAKLQEQKAQPAQEAKS